MLQDQQPPDNLQPAPEENHPFLQPYTSQQPADTQESGQPYKVDEFVQSRPARPAQPSRLFDIPITKLLLIANCIVFLAMVVVSGGRAFMGPSARLLLDFGADYGPLTFSGEYWRLFANMFVHIGIIHIAMNMYALWIIGDLVERLFGSSKFLFLYLTAGVGGALTSLLFNPQTISAGASGAIFGAYGSMLAFVKVNARHYPPGVLSSVTRTVVILLIYNLMFGMASPGIDNACHIGGFLTGLIVGSLMAPAHPSVKTWTAKDAAWAVAIGFILSGLFVLDRAAFAG